MVPITVRRALEAAVGKDNEALYIDDTEAKLKANFVPEETVEIGGKTYTLSSISRWDVKIFADELDTQLVTQNPFIHNVYGKNGVSLLDLVRMVNVNTKQGFKGGRGSGNELDHAMFSAPQFYDPDNSESARTTWERTIASTGQKNFFEGATAGAEMTMTEEQGLVFLGFYNPATAPCIDGVQIIMNTDAFNIQALDFAQLHVELGDPIIELKAPWTVPPEQSGEMLSHYYKTGTDETQPLGIWIKRARELRSLTDRLI